VKYIGAISYEGGVSGSRVDRFELIDAETALLDLVSTYSGLIPPETRFLAIAKKEHSGTFITPWVYFLNREYKHHANDRSARFSFAIINHDSTMITIEGTWEEDDQTVYEFRATLHPIETVSSR